MYTYTTLTWSAKYGIPPTAAVYGRSYPDIKPQKCGAWATEHISPRIGVVRVELVMDVCLVGDGRRRMRCHFAVYIGV
jgi:hypothetical protein